jgi:hypothetical protein
MKVFKATQRFADGFAPVLTPHDPIRFRIGKTTRPPKGWGPIGAFTLVSEAVSYLLAQYGERGVTDLVGGSFAILECEATIFRGPFPVRDGEPIAQWAEGDTERGPAIHDLPPGTVLCESIRPIRVVDEETWSAMIHPSIWVHHRPEVDRRPIVYPGLHVHGPWGGDCFALARPDYILNRVPRPSRISACVELAVEMARATSALSRAETNKAD